MDISNIVCNKNQLQHFKNKNLIQIIIMSTLSVLALVMIGISIYYAAIGITYSLNYLSNIACALLLIVIAVITWFDYVKDRLYKLEIMVVGSTSIDKNMSIYRGELLSVASAVYLIVSIALFTTSCMFLFEQFVGFDLRTLYLYLFTFALSVYFLLAYILYLQTDKIYNSVIKFTEKQEGK